MKDNYSGYRVVTFLKYKSDALDQEREHLARVLYASSYGTRANSRVQVMSTSSRISCRVFFFFKTAFNEAFNENCTKYTNLDKLSMFKFDLLKIEET